MDIRLINVTKRYKSLENHYIDSLDNLNIDINYQNYTCFVGPTGSGKSTLLNIITGIIKPTSGEVFWGKTGLSRSSDSVISYKRRKLFGIVFQDARFISELSVEDNILLPLVITSADLPEKRRYYETLMEKMNITDLRKRMPDELSGGEKKKVAIVRALINNPGILIADEPTSNLDDASAREVFNIFTNLNKLGLTIVVATHDERFSQFCKEIYYMSRGRIERFVSRENPA